MKQKKIDDLMNYFKGTVLENEWYDFMKMLLRASSNSKLVKSFIEKYGKSLLRLCDELKRLKLMKPLFFSLAYNLSDNNKTRLYLTIKRLDHANITISNKLLLALFNNLNPLAKIIKILNKSQMLTHSNLLKILQFKNSYYLRIKKILYNLASHNKLDDNAFALMIQMVGHKITKPKISTMTTKKLCINNETWRKFTLNNQLLFYTNNKNKLESNHGKILKGYKKIYGNDPELFVKFTRKSRIFNENKKNVLREVKNTILLNRLNLHYFKFGKRWCFVSEFLEGKALADFQADELINFPLQKRIKFFQNLLNELYKLHSKFRLHGDIKPDNCILNIKDNTLKLVDFESTRKLKAKTCALYHTPEYEDKKLASKKYISNYYKFCDDIYSMGIIVAFLFPEIFEIKYSSKGSVVSTYVDRSPTTRGCAIIQLVENMMCNVRKARCSCYDALNYCNLLLKNFHNLTDKKLNSILRQTLLKDHKRAEDIILGSTKKLTI